MRCPRCKRKTLRVQVSVFLDIPASLSHALTKGSLRSKDVKIDGADWPRCVWYCTRCRWTARLG